jgi:hypothetical protein
MTKLESVLDSLTRNQRFAHYDLAVVMVPFEHVRMLDRKYREQKAMITADPHLTNDGKQAAATAARQARDKAIAEWHETRLKGLDADLLQQRAALMAQSDKPDQRRVDLMAAELVKFAPGDRAVLYSSATDAERRVLGRVGLSRALARKSATASNGKRCSIEWSTPRLWIVRRSPIRQPPQRCASYLRFAPCKQPSGIALSEI